MGLHLGFYNTSGTRTRVRLIFSTNAQAGGNIAPLSAFEAADITIYKAADSAAFSATQRSSTSGWVMTSPFDSLTGVHELDIDLTDNTDAGFYAAGGLYSIVLAPDTETIDSQTITGQVLGYFEIGVQPVNTIQVAGTTQTAGDVGAKTGFALTAACDPAKTASQAGDAMALTAGERTTLTAAIWAYVMTGTLTVVQLLRGLAAIHLGHTTGMNTATQTVRDLADSKDVGVATVGATTKTWVWDLT